MGLSRYIVGRAWSFHSGWRPIYRRGGKEYWFDIAGRQHPVRWYRFPQYVK